MIISTAIIVTIPVLNKYKNHFYDYYCCYYNLIKLRAGLPFSKQSKTCWMRSQLPELRYLRGN